MENTKLGVSWAMFLMATFLITVGLPILSEVGCKEKGPFSCFEEYPESELIAGFLIGGAVVLIVFALVNLFLPYSDETTIYPVSGAGPSLPKTHENYWNEDRYN